MKAPKDILEVYLQPGEFYFGDEKTRLRTLLGSCVAITMWHPVMHIGGMCHYMLPQDRRRETRKITGLEKRKESAKTIELDGRYAEDAIQMFLHEIHLARTRPVDYQVKLFGGGRMFAAHSKANRSGGVSDQNIEYGLAITRQYGFKLAAQDVGGEGHRNIILDLWSGDVWVRNVKSVNS